MNNKILTLLSLLVMSSCQADSRIADYEISFVKIDTALKIYFLDCGHYPETLSELNDKQLCRKWLKRDYHHVDISDKWGKLYRYRTFSAGGVQHMRYELLSYGEDGIPGTEDDISSDIDPSIWRLYYNKKYSSQK